jgi:hypothetical protein
MKIKQSNHPFPNEGLISISGVLNLRIDAYLYYGEKSDPTHHDIDLPVTGGDHCHSGFPVPEYAE